MAIPKLQAYALPESHDIPQNKVDWAFEPQRAALLTMICRTILSASGARTAR